MKSLCRRDWCHGCERLYFEQYNITWDLSLRLRTHPTQNKYKKIVVLKLMFLLIAANHGQSIQQRIFISRPVETTDLAKYANKMFKNDCFIDLEVGKLCLSFLLAVISEKMFASHVFPDKNQKPLRMSRMQIAKQAVAILLLISGNVFFFASKS